MRRPCKRIYRSQVRTQTDEVALSDIFEILRRHRRLIVGCCLLFLAIGIWLSLAPRNYKADSTIRVQLGSESQYRSSPSGANTVEVADEFAPYVDVLESRSLFLQVAKDLDLANNPVFVHAPLSGRNSIDDPKVRSAVLSALAGRIAVIHKPKEEVIRITCATPSPQLSAKVVNTLINDFVDQLVQSRYGASKRASGWLTGQLGDLKKQVESDQDKLSQLQARLGIIGSDEKDSNYLLAESLNSLTKASSDATVQRIVAEAKYRFLQESDPALIEGEINILGGNSTNGPISNSLLQTLRSALAVQSSDYSKVLAQFGPNWPDVVQKKAQLDETKRQVQAEEARILNQAKLSYSAASENEKMTQRELAGKQDQSSDLRNDMVKYIILQHDYESHRNLYEGLVSRLQEAGITAGLGGGEVEVIDLADVPTRPVPPGRLTYMGGGLLTGLVFGCVLAFVVEALNTRLITVEQALRSSSLPVLAVLPDFRSKGILLGSAQESPYLEAVETLRSFLLSTEAETKQVLLITSPREGEGKSTTSAHLAAVLAEHGTKTLLIDCDLRSDSIAVRLSLRGETGLSNLLTGMVKESEAIQKISSIPDLDIIVSGPSVTRRPAVLLGSSSFTDLIEGARKQYKFIVLNCPPVLGLPDVFNVGLVADAVVLIVRSRITRRKDLSLAEQALGNAHLPVVGYVLNSVSDRSGPYVYRPKRSSHYSSATKVAS